MRSRAATAAVTVLLTAATALVALVFAGKIALVATPPETGTVFYVVPYHYGFVFYDEALRERPAIEVRVGEVVTLHVVPAHALSREAFLGYSERSRASRFGELPPGDPRIGDKIAEDLALGNVEHILGIAGHPVYLTTNVAAVLNGRPFRPDGPRTLADAVRARDPAIRSVTFTARRAGAFDVLCVDSGLDGQGTCGWGHKWMVARAGFVVRP